MPLALRSFVESGEDLATTGIILMELVAGATAAEDAEARHTELRVEPIAAA